MMHYSLVSVFGSLAWERLRAHHTGYCVDPVSGEGGEEGGPISIVLIVGKS